MIAVDLPDRTTRMGVALALLALLAADPALAHGPPATARGDTRLLVDQNDDCGGDDAGALGRCGGTHDLVALDARQVDDGGKPAIRFALLLNGGDPGHVLTDMVRLEVDGQATRVNLTFEGDAIRSDVGRATGPRSANDGTRFWVDAFVPLADIGAGAGSALTGFHVQARRDGELGDFMVGSYQGPDGPGPDSASEAAEPTTYVRPRWDLQSSADPTGGLTATDPTSATDDNGAPGWGARLALGALAFAASTRSRRLRR